MKPQQITAFAIAVLLFLSGAAVGVLGHRYYAETTVRARTNDDFRQHYISEMRSKLKLTPSQVKQLEGIMDETKAEFHAVRESMHPQMVKIKQQHVERVKAILTPAQEPIYAQIVAEHERSAREMDQH